MTCAIRRHSKRLAHRQRSGRINAGARDVERELADGDAHAVGAEIAEAQDSAAVREDRDVDVGDGERVEDVLDVALVLDREVKTAVMVREECAELLACGADRGRVCAGQHTHACSPRTDEGRQLGQIVGEELVEEVRVRRTEGLPPSARGVRLITHAEELVALQVRRLGANALQAALHLHVDRTEVERLGPTDLFRGQAHARPSSAHLVGLQARAEEDFGCERDGISALRASRGLHRGLRERSNDGRARRWHPVAQQFAHTSPIDGRANGCRRTGMQLRAGRHRGRHGDGCREASAFERTDVTCRREVGSGARADSVEQRAVGNTHSEMRRRAESAESDRAPRTGRPVSP